MVAQPSILFVNRVYPPDRGATGRCLADLAEAFALAGWRVTVVACGKGRETKGRIEVVRAGGSRAAGDRLGGLRYLWALIALAARAVSLRRQDVVVTMTDPPLLAAAGPLLKLVWRARLIHWSHDLYPDLLPVLGRKLPDPVMSLLGAAAAWSIRRHDKVVAIGSCMAARLAGSAVPRDRIATISNWGDRLRPCDPSAFRREHGLDGRWIILYSGNFGLAHPFEAVLEAAALLEQSMPSALFLLAGSGRRRGEVAAEIARRGIGNIRLLPPQPADRLGEMFASADLHLATMLPEAEGMLVPCKVQSSFAAGRPCLFVGPAGSAAARMIAEYGAGAALAPEGAALAREIARLAQDGTAWVAACSGAVQADAEHGFESAACRFTALATALVSERKRPRSLLRPAGDADRA